MGTTLTLLLIPCLPLVAFLLLGIFGKSTALLEKGAGIIATLFMAISCFPIWLKQVINQLLLLVTIGSTLVQAFLSILEHWLILSRL